MYQNFKELINLTPHAINFIASGVGDEEHSVPPSGIIARVSTKEEVIGCLAVSEQGIIPVISRSMGEVTGIPEPVEGTIYIVGSMVFDASDRTDICAPDTGDSAIRENGQVRAVTRFVMKKKQEVNLLDEAKKNLDVIKALAKENGCDGKHWLSGEIRDFDYVIGDKRLIVTRQGCELCNKWITINERYEPAARRTSG